VTAAEYLRAQLTGDPAGEFVIRHIPRAFAGNVKAAQSLVWLAPNWARPMIVECLWSAYLTSKTVGAKQAFKAAMAACWEHDHDAMLGLWRRDPSTLRLIMQMDRYVPADLPKRVTVWRGGRGPIERLRRGWSWTTDRATVCWFATQWIANRSVDNLLVIKATVDARRVVHSENGRNEAELVIFGCRSAVVDGDVAEWRATGLKTRPTAA
jgi:hypothetical protein